MPSLQSQSLSSVNALLSRRDIAPVKAGVVPTLQQHDDAKEPPLREEKRFEDDSDLADERKEGGAASDAHHQPIIDSHGGHEDLSEPTWEEDEGDAGGEDKAPLSELSHHPDEAGDDSDADPSAQREAQHAAAQRYREEQLQSLASHDPSDSLDVPPHERERTQVAIDDDDDDEAAQQSARQRSGDISIELSKDMLGAAGDDGMGQGKGKKRAAKDKASAPRFTAQSRALLLRVRRMHLLTQLVLLQRWSGLCDQPELQGLTLSLLPAHLHLSDDAPATPSSSSSASSLSSSAPRSPPTLQTFNLPYLQSLLSWYHNLFHLDVSALPMLTSLCSLGNVTLYLRCVLAQLSVALGLRRGCAQAKVVLFVALLRGLGLQARYVHGMEVEPYAWSQEGWMEELRRKAGVGVDVGRSASMTMVIMGRTVEAINFKENRRRLWRVITARSNALRGNSPEHWMCDCGKPVEPRNAEAAALVIPPAKKVSIRGRTISISRDEEDREEVLVDDDDDDREDSVAQRRLDEARRRKKERDERSPKQAESEARAPARSQPPSSGRKRARKEASREAPQPIKPKRASRASERGKTQSDDDEEHTADARDADQEDDEENAPLSKRSAAFKREKRANGTAAKRCAPLIPSPPAAAVTEAPLSAADDAFIVLSSDDDEAVEQIKAAEAQREAEERARLLAMERDDDVPPPPIEAEAVDKQLVSGEAARPKRRKTLASHTVKRKLVTADEDEEDDDDDVFEAAVRPSPSSSSPAPAPSKVQPSREQEDADGEGRAEDDSADVDDGNGEEDHGCMVCGFHSSTKKNRILLCDGVACGRECHVRCTEPRLRAVPEGEWFCSLCTQRDSAAASAQRGARPLSTSTASFYTVKPKVHRESDDGNDEENVVRPVKEEAADRKKDGVFVQFHFSGAVEDAHEPAVEGEKTSRPKRERKAAKKEEKVDDGNDDDDDSVLEDVTPQRKAKVGRKATKPRSASSSSPSSASSRRAPQRRSSSSSSPSASSPTSQAKKKADGSAQFTPFWCEVYIPAQERWVHIDPLNCLLDEPATYEALRPRHIFAYVLAAYPRTQLLRTSSSSASLQHSATAFGRPIIQDLTPRYSVGGHTVNRQRLDEGWWESLRLSISAPLDSPIDARLHAAEQSSFSSSLCEVASQYPTSLAGLKKHPQYTCVDNLKKFEALRPGTRPVTRLRLGKADVTLYKKEDVCPLHTVDRWMREKRQVRESELQQPVKLVKSHTMASRKKRKMRQYGGSSAGAFTSLALDAEAAAIPSSAAAAFDDDGEELATLYGLWQTDPWTPPAAANGLVPKNARGQVDLWDPTHLPGGCVHLPYPRIASIARKLGVDHGEAMVGFEVKHGRSVPRFEGIVVTAENADWVLEAYQQREKELKEKADAKRWERVAFNWRRLVRGAVVRSDIMRGLTDRSAGEGTMEQKGGKGKKKTATAATAATGKAEGRGGKGKAAVPTGAVEAEVENDLSHVHDFSQKKSMDVATGTWHATCLCGARTEYQEL